MRYNGVRGYVPTAYTDAAGSDADKGKAGPSGTSPNKRRKVLGAVQVSQDTTSSMIIEAQHRALGLLLSSAEPGPDTQVSFSHSDTNDPVGTNLHHGIVVTLCTTVTPIFKIRTPPKTSVGFLRAS